MLHPDKLVNGVADHIIINRRINGIILRLGAITQQQFCINEYRLSDLSLGLINANRRLTA